MTRGQRPLGLRDTVAVHDCRISLRTISQQLNAISARIGAVLPIRRWDTVGVLYKCMLARVSDEAYCHKKSST